MIQRRYVRRVNFAAGRGMRTFTVRTDAPASCLPSQAELDIAERDNNMTTAFLAALVRTKAAGHSRDPFVSVTFSDDPAAAVGAIPPTPAADAPRPAFKDAAQLAAWAAGLFGIPVGDLAALADAIAAAAASSDPTDAGIVDAGLSARRLAYGARS